MRKESSTDLPLLELWCACHRSNLAWVSVTKSVPEVQKAIRKASAGSTFSTNIVQDGESLERWPKKTICRP